VAPAVDLDLSGRDGPRSEEALEELAASRPDLTGDAHDLAAADGQGHVVHGSRRAEVLDRQSRRPPFVPSPRLMRCRRLAVPTDHGGDDAGRGEVVERPLGDGTTVAQHGDAVGELEQLVEPVGHEDDRHPLVLQGPDDVEQGVGLVLVQRAGRLVEDEDAGVHRQRPRDLHHLTLVGPEVPHRSVDIDVHPEPGQRLGRCVPAGTPVDPEGRASQTPTHEDVLRHGQLGRVRDLLRHHREAVGQRARGRSQRDGVAVEEDLPSVG